MDKSHFYQYSIHSVAESLTIMEEFEGRDSLYLQPVKVEVEVYRQSLHNIKTSKVLSIVPKIKLVIQ